MDYIVFLADLSGGTPIGVIAVLIGFWLLFSTPIYFLTKRKIVSIFSGYLLAGFFGLGLPMKLILPATSWFGSVFLSLIWPIWITQSFTGLNVFDYIPDWLGMLFFV